jgi:hypothetical protein
MLILIGDCAVWLICTCRELEEKRKRIAARLAKRADTKVKPRCFG